MKKRKKRQLGHKQFYIRNAEIIALFKRELFNMAEIARLYNMTRERCRQIVYKEIGRDVATKISVKVRNFKKIDAENKRKEKYGDDYLEKREFKHKRKKEVELGFRWHWEYDACLRCNSTKRPYHSKGFCARCYQADRYECPEIRRKHQEVIRKYHVKLRLDEKRYALYVEKQRKYHKKYNIINKEKRKEEIKLRSQDPLIAESLRMKARRNYRTRIAPSRVKE